MRSAVASHRPGRSAARPGRGSGARCRPSASNQAAFPEACSTCSTVSASARRRHGSPDAGRSSRCSSTRRRSSARVMRSMPAQTPPASGVPVRTAIAWERARRAAAPCTTTGTLAKGSAGTRRRTSATASSTTSGQESSTRTRRSVPLRLLRGSASSRRCARDASTDAPAPASVRGGRTSGACCSLTRATVGDPTDSSAAVHRQRFVGCGCPQDPVQRARPGHETVGAFT